VEENLGWTAAQVAQLPKKQVYISSYGPASGPLASATPQGQTAKIEVPHTHNLSGQQPLVSLGGNELRLASAKEFPGSFNMSGALIHLEPGAMRQLHWHPNADEWQYVLNGEMDLTVFASEGKASVSRLQQGDVGYVPKGYGHAIRNSSQKPLDIVVVFNDGDYQSIDLSNWLASNPSSVLGNTFQISPELTKQLPVQDTIFSLPTQP
jgi:oxalate decarboxylase